MIAVTGLRRLGYAVVALVVIVFGAMAAIALFLPADDVRNAVKAEIKAVTGFEPIFKGSSSISLFPSGSVSFSDVVLGEDDKDAPLAAERLNARLRFLPLLAGRVEISDVWLENPRILVTLGPDSQSNWSSLIAALGRAFAPKASGDGKAVSFSEIRIAGGTILIRDDARNIAEELSDVEMSLAWPAISKSFAATGRFNWRGETVDTSASVADFSAALSGEKTGLKFRFAGLPAKFTYDGTFSLRPTLKMDGVMAADAPSLRRALHWIEHKNLPSGGFERFSLKAQTNVVGGTLALSNVNLELDGNAAEGVLTFATEGRPMWQGTLAADVLDLTPYISGIRLLAANERKWNSQPIDLEGLEALELDLRLSAAKITLGNAKLGRTAVAANLREGKFSVTVGEARAYGGVIRGSVSFGKANESAELKSQLQFADIDLEPCIGDLLSLRRIEGKGHLAITMEAHGTTVLDLAESINGTATLTGRQGALNGIDVEQLLRRLERRPLSAGNEFRGGRTPFERLSLAVKFADGTATIEDFHVQGPAVRLAVAGTASVPARDFDLKGIASLVTPAATDGRAPFELPFYVQGPWDNPLLLPDTQILIQRSGAAAPLLKRLPEGRLRDAAEDALKRLGRSPAPAGQNAEQTGTPPAPQ